LKPASYSYSWAMSVVNQLYDKYPRATEVVKEILQITDRHLAAYLANADPLWPDLRNLVKVVDNDLKSCAQPWNTPAHVKCTSIYLRRKGKERLADRLDAVQNGLIL
jgi:hypothetical protein